MLKILFVFALFTLTLFLPGQTHAQTTDTWTVILYAHESHQLITLTPAGITTRISLPDEMIAAGSTVNQVTVSHDLQFVALVAHDTNYRTSPLIIADLQNGRCCIRFVPEVGELMAYDLAGFDPGGTMLALSYAVENPAAEFFYEGGMMVLDAATGDIVTQIHMEDVPPEVTGGDGAVWAIMGRWDRNGVRFHPSCMGCEPPFEGEYALWQPSDNTYQAESGEFFTGFGVQLEHTGEILTQTRTVDYPYSPEPSFYFPAGNVVISTAAELPPVEIRFGGVDTLLADIPVVFFDPQDINLNDNQIFWVDDGRAFIVSSEENTTWKITLREVSPRTITVPSGSRVLAGTPDGFVTHEADAIVHYRMTGSSLERTQLGEVPGGLLVVQSPDLGASLGGRLTAFPVIEAPSPEEFERIKLAHTITCEGFMPSRLMWEDRGRVTPGTPNTIREAPTTSSTRLGSIPGGSEFSIISGPECAEGYAWWFIEYNRIYGYTAEGTGDSYFLEPIR